MFRKVVSIRLKLVLIEKIYLLAKHEGKSKQDIFEELLELGYIEKLKGGNKYGKEL